VSYIEKVVNSSVTLGILMTKSGQGLTGLSPTIEIRRHSDDHYLDFSAGVAPFWVTTGGQRELTLPEQPWLGGWYTWAFDHATYDPDAQEDYSVIYRNTVPYRTLLTEILSFTSAIGNAFEYIRTLLENDQDLVKHSNERYEHKIYGDAGETGPTVYEADITLVGNTEKRRRTKP